MSEDTNESVAAPIESETELNKLETGVNLAEEAKSGEAVPDEAVV